MAVGLAATWANALLDSLVNGAAFTPDAAIWIKLHTGDPGASGTSNAATETTRKQLSGDTPSGGTVTTDTALTWTGVSGSEDFTHYSAWTASTGGSFRWSGTVSANAVQIGDTFTIPAGDFDISLTVAA